MRAVLRVDSLAARPGVSGVAKFEESLPLPYDIEDNRAEQADCRCGLADRASRLVTGFIGESNECYPLTSYALVMVEIELRLTYAHRLTFPSSGRPELSRDAVRHRRLAHLVLSIEDMGGGGSLQLESQVPQFFNISREPLSVLLFTYYYTRTHHTSRSQWSSKKSVLPTPAVSIPAASSATFS